MVTVSFPGLGIGEFSFNKVAFSIGSIEVRWYGIIMVTGIILAFLYAYYRSKQEGISFDDLLDYALITVISGVVGARLYYVITSGEEYTFGEIFAIWNGGIAIYGAIIGGAAALLGVSLYKKIKWQKAFDMVCPGVMIGQIVGRWGNFFNGEAYGESPAEDSLLYFMRMELRHEGWSNSYICQPTFLYESLWNLVGFLIINALYKKKKYDGQVFLMIFGWYGLGRMWIEGLRMDSLYLFGSSIRVSQALAIVLFVVCTALLVYFAIKKPDRPFYHMTQAAEIANEAEAHTADDQTVSESKVAENTVVTVAEVENLMKGDGSGRVSR